MPDSPPAREPHDESRSPSAPRFGPAAQGAAYAVLSAVAYTGASLALNAAKRPNDFDWAIWVSCVKAAPAAVVAWVLVARLAARGLPALPPKEAVVPLLATGLFMQFGGNVMFQWALGLGGLALTVPLSFAALICAGAWLGRIILGEPVTARTALSIMLMLVAICLLSAGARASTRDVVADASLATVITAILAACCSGAAYGMNSVMIRRTLKRKVSIPATLVLLSSSGIVWLGLLSLWRLGPEEIAGTTPREMGAMLAAGLMNAVAFFSVGGALRHISVVRLNLLNASQTALAAVAGVLFFAERVTPWLVAGTTLTVIGLAALGIRRTGGSA
ncbi:MAG: DMT family transporter [Planctomycetaceae bacterium]